MSILKLKSKDPVLTNGFSKKEMDSIKKVYRGFFRSGGNRKAAIEKIESEFPKTKVTQKLLDFIKHSNRGII